MGDALCIDGLGWSFQAGDPPFLRVDYLAVSPGQLVAVTGPSGAGKSTLLSLLAGFEAAHQGALSWGEVSLGALSPAARDQWRRTHVGLVFQDFQLVPELTAVENVLLPLTFGHWRVGTTARRRALDLLARLGVARPTARAASLSRGEMQRTSLARALLGEPSVVLADEPTASLDADNETSVTELLVTLAREGGSTVVVATHQPRLVARADRVLRLDHGLVTEESR